MEIDGTYARTRTNDGLRGRGARGGWRAGVAGCAAGRISIAARASAGGHCVPRKTWLVLFPRGDVYPAERGAYADPLAGAMAEKVKQFELNLAPERKIWSVAELTARISGVLSSQF